MLSREDVIDYILDPPGELIEAIPEIAPLVGLDQNHPNHQYDAWGHIAYSVAAASGDPIVRLALLFHDIGKGDVLKSGEGGFNFNGHMELGAHIARKRLTQMGADQETVDLVSELVGIHDINIGEREVGEWLERLGEKNLRRWFEIKRGDMIAHTDPYRTEMLALVDRNEAELDEALGTSGNVDTHNGRTHMDGNVRREKLLEAIEAEGAPISASALAGRLGVSRQIIVSDVAILRAKGDKIIATSRGYMMERQNAGGYVGRIAVKHTGAKTRDELSAIVRAGGTIVDVTITHPFYGDLTGSLNIATLSDVDDFIADIQGKKGKLLLDLTGGIHMHTISCADRKGFDAVVSELSRMGILIPDTD